MLARHRQSLILQAVRNDGSARVSDLTQRLGVSDMTIRRDLEVLARDGLVEKVHGGAVLPGSPASHEPGFEAKLVLERPEKNTIARAAAGLVTPGTAIAIAGGTTTFELAQCLLDVPGLTIVTNSLRVAGLFSGTRGLDGRPTGGADRRHPYPLRRTRRAGGRPDHRIAPLRHALPRLLRLRHRGRTDHA